MTLVEFRETTFNKAVDAVKDSKHHIKKLKAALCDIEDALYEYYDSEGDDDREDEEYYDEDYQLLNKRDEEDDDVNYRRRRSMRMRMRNGSTGMSRTRMRSMYRNRYDY